MREIDIQNSWRASSSTYSRLPAENQPVFHQLGFDNVRHGFQSSAHPSTEIPFTSNLFSQNLPGNFNHTSNKLPTLQNMNTGNQGVALPQGFQGPPNESRTRNESPSRMSFQMTTPMALHKSVSQNIRSTPVCTGREGEEHTCQCPLNESMPSSPTLPTLAARAYDMATRPYTHVPVAGLLNSTHSQSQPQHPFTSNNPSQPLLSAQQFSHGIDKNEDMNKHVHNSSPHRIQSLSTFSAASSSTIRAGSSPGQPQAQSHYSAIEDRCFLLNTLYDICVEATASYVLSLVPLRHFHSHRNRRWQPYSSNRGTHFKASNNGAGRGFHGGVGVRGNGGKARSGGRGRERTTTRTLMDNVSRISTHLWRKARNDVMAPHRAEADAVKDMRDLYAWGELVAKGWDTDGLLDLDLVSESESGCGSEYTLEEGEIADGGSVNTWKRRGCRDSDGVELGRIEMRIGKAAKRICEWVGDEEALDSCVRVVEELRDGTRERERNGGGAGTRVVEVDDGEDMSIS